MNVIEAIKLVRVYLWGTPVDSEVFKTALRTMIEAIETMVQERTDERTHKT